MRHQTQRYVFFGGEIAIEGGAEAEAVDSVTVEEVEVLCMPCESHVTRDDLGNLRTTAAVCDCFIQTEEAATVRHQETTTR